MARNTDNSRHWTNERHVHFLNSMEASFVQNMLENNGRFPPPLDRYLPDTSDSTSDSNKFRHRRSFISDNVESSGRTEKKKRISCQKSSQDQVVPQFQNKRDDDKEDKDDNGSS